MHGTKFQQLFHSGTQLPVAHSSEVVEGEEVKVLCQVTRQAVELVQQAEERDIQNLKISLLPGFMK